MENKKNNLSDLFTVTPNIWNIENKSIKYRPKLQFSHECSYGLIMFSYRHKHLHTFLRLHC